MYMPLKNLYVKLEKVFKDLKVIKFICKIFVNVDTNI